MKSKTGGLSLLGKEEEKKLLMDIIERDTAETRVYKRRGENDNISRGFRRT